MQNDSIDNLRLDMNKKSIRGVIYVRSGDTRARTIHITLTNNGSVVDLSNAYICELLIKKPDGSENDQAMVRVGNELQYTFRTQDINVPGECKCQVMVTFEDSAEVVSSEFSVMVYQKTIDQSLEQSTNEYTSIQQQLAEANSLRTQAAADADRAESAREGIEDCESRCKTYADNASADASDASDSATSASNSASEASGYVALVKEYRDDAATYCEETRTNLQSVEDKAQEILAYDSSAKDSADNAAISETNAGNSADAAADSEANAATSEKNAEAWAKGTKNGTPVPDTDPAYENNAKYYSEQAAASAASIPSALSGFTNDCGFIDNTVNDLVNYYTKSQTYTQTEINNLIAAINEFNIEFVNALPSSGIDTHTIYFLARVTPELNDYYDEYINTDGTSAGWELIGSTQVDLSQYYTKTEVDNLIAGVGSGHTIVDASGTDMTQRSDLQFADSFVSDDDVNGKTVVENIKEHSTKADYDNATEDGFHVIDDGEDAVIHPSSDDKVEVTADGVKKRGVLFNELFALIDSSKVSDSSMLDIGGAIFQISIITNSEYRFGSLGVDSNSNTFLTTAIVNASNSKCERITIDSNTSAQYRDLTTNKPSNGTKITLYYGNKKAVVDLQTTANRCLMGDGTTVEQALTITKKLVAPLVGVSSSVANRNFYVTDKRTFIEYHFILDSSTTAIGNDTKIFDFPYDIDTSNITYQYFVATQIKNNVSNLVYASNSGIYLSNATSTGTGNYLVGTIRISLL